MTAPAASARPADPAAAQRPAARVARHLRRAGPPGPAGGPAGHHPRLGRPVARRRVRRRLPVPGDALAAVGGEQPQPAPVRQVLALHVRGEADALATKGRRIDAAQRETIDAQLALLDEAKTSTDHHAIDAAVAQIKGEGEPVSDPDPEPDPDPEDPVDPTEPDPWDEWDELTTRLAPRVAAYVGRPGDADTTATASAQLPVVAEYVRGYTRGRGFEGERPAAPLRAVIVAATARLATNPEQVTVFTTGDYSERPAILAGWTLTELGVLRRYRRTTA